MSVLNLRNDATCGALMLERKIIAERALSTLKLNCMACHAAATGQVHAVFEQDKNVALEAASSGSTADYPEILLDEHMSGQVILGSFCPQRAPARARGASM